MKKYAFINRYEQNIKDSNLSFYAIKMYAYMVRILANEMISICDELDMALSISRPVGDLADELLVKNTISELLNEKWIVEVKNQTI